MKVKKAPKRGLFPVKEAQNPAAFEENGWGLFPLCFFSRKLPVSLPRCPKYSLIPVLDPRLVTNLKRCAQTKGLRFFRLKAQTAFADVKRGDLGGIVCGPHNLSHEGTCWIYKNGAVLDDARVEQHAIVVGGCMTGRARNTNSAQFHGGLMADESRISGNAWVDCDKMLGSCSVEGNAKITGGWAYLDGHVRVRDNALVEEFVTLRDCVIVEKNAQLGGHVSASGHVLFTDEARASGNFLARGHLEMGGKTILRNERDYLTFIQNLRKPSTETPLRQSCEAYGYANGSSRSRSADPQP